MQPQLRGLMRRLEQPLLGMRKLFDRLLQFQQFRHADVALVIAVAAAFEDWSGVGAHLDELEDVAELFLLRLEVLARVVRGSDLQRDALDDLEAEALDGDVLGGIVRQQTDLADAEVAEDLGAGAVVADVAWEA